MPSPRRSRNWSLFPNLRRPQSSANSLRLASRNLGSQSKFATAANRIEDVKEHGDGPRSNRNIPKHHVQRFIRSGGTDLSLQNSFFADRKLIPNQPVSALTARIWTLQECMSLIQKTKQTLESGPL